MSHIILHDRINENKQISGPYKWYNNATASIDRTQQDGDAERHNFGASQVLTDATHFKDYI